jgi:hypothetical protein
MGTAAQIGVETSLRLLAVLCAFIVLEVGPHVLIPTAPRVAPVVGLPEDDDPDDED